MMRSVPKVQWDHLHRPPAGNCLRCTPITGILRTWGALLGLLLGIAVASAVPPNDDITQATVITALPFADGPLDTTAATMAPDDPDCAGNGPTVWYVFTPARPVIMAANTFGSNYDTTLSVYTGSPGALTQIACNDDFGSLQSAVSFEATTGTTYFLMVGSYASGSGGSVFLHVEGTTQFLVTTTQERGPGSLRQAILDANANIEMASAIAFHIPRTDPAFDGRVFTIQPTTPLPTLRRPTTIDGTTQTAFSGDSNPFGPEVVLNGSLLEHGHGFVLRGDRSAIIGLVINGFAHGAGISLQASLTETCPLSQHRLLNNYIGTDRTGTTAVPNARGVVIHGGNSPATQARANTLEDNLIAGNLGVGISLCEAAETRIAGNRIGTDRTGTTPLGNGSHGVYLHCASAPRTVIEQNTIAFNAGDGIRLAPDYRSAVALTPAGHHGTAIRRNALFANAGLGINLLPPPFGTEDGSTPNDVCDADAGANRLQNFPELTLATSDGRSTRISGILHSLPRQVFEIDFFANVTADPTGFGEGEFFLGTVPMVTDTTCQGTFTAVVPFGTLDLWLTATATDAAGNTSEFSPALAVQEIMFSCQGGGPASIGGQITTADTGQGLAGVAVELFREEDSCQEQTMTDAQGGYQLANLGPGTYVVLPSHSTCRFVPPNWRVRLDGGDAEVPFTAHCTD
jgi:parallel beta-helix repeat protein